MGYEADVVDLHRDENGNGLLVGPDCPDCGRRHDARYRCLVCGETLTVPGEFRWSWQGRGHWHEADDASAWHRWMTDHRAQHGGVAAFVPVQEDA